MGALKEVMSVRGGDVDEETFSDIKEMNKQGLLWY